MEAVRRHGYPRCSAAIDIASSQYPFGTCTGGDKIRQRLESVAREKDWRLRID